jgi:pyruvate formate lyase activating enzyme
MSAEAARQIAPRLDAINIDLKAFTDKFYKAICGARLKPVLETIERMKALAVWVEVTTLIIPGLNDAEEELREIARFVKSVGHEVPWHVTAFYPTYELMDRPPTPVATLRRAREIGMEEGLGYVYEGNLPGVAGESTYCYACGAVGIERSGTGFIRNRLHDGKCPECGKRVDGVGVKSGNPGKWQGDSFPSFSCSLKRMSAPSAASQSISRKSPFPAGIGKAYHDMYRQR